MTTLIIIDQAPYGNWHGRDLLDMAFSLAAFDQACQLLFRGEGVHWLRAGQLADAISQKTGLRQVAAAPIFGIDGLYADADALDAAGLATDAAAMKVDPVIIDSAFYTRFSRLIQL